MKSQFPIATLALALLLAHAPTGLAGGNHAHDEPHGQEAEREGEHGHGHGHGGHHGAVLRDHGVDAHAADAAGSGLPAVRV